MTKPILLAVAVVLLAATVQPPRVSAEECPRWQTITGPTGITLKLCMDGKYTTCIRDSRRLGWRETHVQSYCGKLLAEGRVK